MAADCDIPSGTLLDNRYVIQRLLGRGGFGRTYLALNQRRWGEPCVLKEFVPAVTDDYVLTKSRELFEREAKTLYKLEHPQIPKFLDVFEEEGRQFLVQQYVTGQNYYQLLRERQRFSPAEVLQWLRDLLPVMEYVHSQNIIHRDISPDNIILPAHGSQPVLIDFGVVKETVTRLFARYTSSSGAQASAVVGKTGYAAPEQLRTGECYPNSDLYSLGVTAVVLLTGNLEPGSLFDSFNEEWRWSESVTVSPGFKAVLDKMMASRPKNRYQTAADVLADLESVSEESEVDSPRPGLELGTGLNPGERVTEVNPPLPANAALSWTETLPMVMTALESITEVKTAVEAVVANGLTDLTPVAKLSLPPTPVSPLPLLVELSELEPETPILPVPSLPATPVSPLPAQIPLHELETPEVPSAPTELVAPGNLDLQGAEPVRSAALGRSESIAIAATTLGLGGALLAGLSPQIPVLCQPFNTCARSAVAGIEVQSILTAYDRVLTLKGDLSTLARLDARAKTAVEPLAKLSENALQSLPLAALEAQRQTVETSQTRLKEEVLKPLQTRLKQGKQDGFATPWLQAAQKRYQATLQRATALSRRLDQSIQEKTSIPTTADLPPVVDSFSGSEPYPINNQPVYRAAPAPLPPRTVAAPEPTQLPLCPGNSC